MSSQRREVPLAYSDLLDAIGNGVFPAERHWVDFKRELYPRPATNGTPSKVKSKSEIHQELARDLASLAVRGGYLIYGVEEDKANHTFTVMDMPLPAHLDQTVDQVARDLITPPLLVAPTLLTNTVTHDSGQGMMVVEVPESPDAPHMVGGIYYGRSETGKVKLTDDEVERLIVRRRRADERVRQAMADTVVADPEPDTEPAHFYFTAVPTQGWPDMLLDYTRNPAAHSSFVTAATEWRNAIARADHNRPSDSPIAFEQLTDYRRGQRPRGAWFYNYPQSPPEQRLGVSRRALGLDDAGTVRFIDMAAGSQPDGLHPAVAERQRMGYPGGSLHSGSVLYDVVVWWETLDLVRLVGRIAESHGYAGSWLIGAELGRMRGRHSSVRAGTECDTDQLTSTYRATTRQLLDRPREVASALLRPLFRDLGSEAVLDQLAREPAEQRF